MAMTSKNWNDRADKDLFFTILSVKNIGVISGAEWSTIGNHMRSQGYVFTNEGCRQHFQGLRRAQSKADANGTTADNARRSDPTNNPITRRPGPGRGRPRKSQQDGLIPSSPAANASPAAASFSTPGHAPMPEQHSGQIHSPMPGQGPGPGPGPTISDASATYAGAVTGHYYGNVSDNVPIDDALTQDPPGPPQPPPPPPPPPPIQQPRVQSVDSPLALLASSAGQPSQPPALSTGTPGAGPSTPTTTTAVNGGDIEEADVDADGAENAEPLEPAGLAQAADQEDDDHPAKRLKLEPHLTDNAIASVEDVHEATRGGVLDEAAVLALAAHNGSGGGGGFGPEFDNYGEG